MSTETGFPTAPMIGQPMLEDVFVLDDLHPHLPLPVLSEREHNIKGVCVQAIYGKAVAQTAKDAGVTIDFVTGNMTAGGTDATAAADMQAGNYGWFKLATA